MDAALLDAWLRRRLTRDANISLLLSPLAILGGILILALTFWVTYLAVWWTLSSILCLPELVANVHWKAGPWTRLGVTTALILVLIVSYLRSDRWQRQDLSVFAKTPASRGLTLSWFGGPTPGILLANPEASSHIIIEILYIGPQLLFTGSNLLMDSGRMRSANTPAAARLLLKLLNHPSRVEHDALATLSPEADRLEAYKTLQRIEGVVFLERGITLTDDLRAELGTLGSKS